jgi:hypothetical protein
MKVFFCRPLNSSPRTDALEESDCGRCPAPASAGVPAIVPGRDLNFLAALCGQRRMSPESQTSPGQSTNLAPAVLFSERASIEPRSEVPRPMPSSGSARPSAPSPARGKTQAFLPPQVRSAQVDLLHLSERRLCPENRKAPIRESRTTPPIRLLTQAPITNSSLDSLVCSTNARPAPQFSSSP